MHATRLTLFSLWMVLPFACGPSGCDSVTRNDLGNCGPYVPPDGGSAEGSTESDGATGGSGGAAGNGGSGVGGNGGTQIDGGGGTQIDGGDAADVRLCDATKAPSEDPCVIDEQ